jgi:hypothetical protein
MSFEFHIESGMQCNNVMFKKCELWTFYKEQNGMWHLQYVWTLSPLCGVECCATFEALRYKLWICHLFCCTKYFKTKLQVETMVIVNKLSHKNWKDKLLTILKTTKCTLFEDFIHDIICLTTTSPLKVNVDVSATVLITRSISYPQFLVSLKKINYFQFDQQGYLYVWVNQVRNS